MTHSPPSDQRDVLTRTRSVTSPPPIERFGGIEGIRAVLQDFYRHVFKDPFIGYLFAAQDREKLVERETQWTARALGVTMPYEGKPLAEAHRAHPIRRGHFHRRNVLLFESIERAGLHPEAASWWHAHSAALESAILGSARSDARCEQTSDESHLKPQPAPLSTWGGRSESGGDREERET